MMGRGRKALTSQGGLMFVFAGLPGQERKSWGLLCSFKGNAQLLQHTAVATAVFCQDSSFQCRKEPLQCLLAV